MDRPQHLGSQVVLTLPDLGFRSTKGLHPHSPLPHSWPRGLVGCIYVCVAWATHWDRAVRWGGSARLGSASLLRSLRLTSRKLDFQLPPFYLSRCGHGPHVLVPPQPRGHGPHVLVPPPHSALDVDSPDDWRFAVDLGQVLRAKAQGCPPLTHEWFSAGLEQSTTQMGPGGKAWAG